jgi:hypothetical protein
VGVITQPALGATRQRDYSRRETIWLSPDLANHGTVGAAEPTRPRLVRMAAEVSKRMSPGGISTEGRGFSCQP